MLLISNVLVCILVAFFFKLDIYVSIILGILIFFLLNLIPHFSIFGEKRGLLYCFFLIIDFSISSVLFILSFVFSLSPIRAPYLSDNVLKINFSSWFVLVSNFLVYLFFWIIEMFLYHDSFFSKIINFKRALEYVDNSIWGLMIHLAIPVLCVLLLLGYLDIGYVFNR